MKTVGELIRAGRHKKRLTQVGLAALIKVDVTYISHLENNNKLPSQEKLEAIAKVLGLNMEELWVAGNYLPDDIYKLVLQLCKEKGCTNVRHLLKEQRNNERAFNGTAVKAANFSN